METTHFTIAIDEKLARKIGKRARKKRYQKAMLKLVLFVSLLLIVFGFFMTLYNAFTPDWYNSKEKKENAEVIGGNRKFNDVVNTSSDELIPPDASLVETDSTKTAEFVATAYCSCQKCCGKWAELREDGPVTGAAGVPLVEGVSVAVDNNLYKFGTVFTDQNGHEYIAADTGSAIVGNKIDVYFSDHQEALEFGVQTITLSWEEL